MMRSRLKQTLRLLTPLRQGKLGERQVVQKTLPPDLLLLRAWQTERLSRSYADLLADPRYQPATEFFRQGIYAPQDFSQRDQDLQQIYDALEGVMPNLVRETLDRVNELNGLTAVLDQLLINTLINQLGVTDRITVPLYAQAYRICDNYAERSHQIDLIMQVGDGVNRLAHIPFINFSLRLARGFTRWSTWSEVQTFFEDGLAAFRHMGSNAETFLQIIEARERDSLEKLFAGADDPFGFDEEE